MARLSRILDANGNPVMVEDLKREVAGPSVTGVRSPVSGDPASGLTPDRLAVILRQAEEGDPLAYFELAERIEERDLHYMGVLGTRKRSVSQIDITVEAASEDADHQRQAEMVRAWLRRDELQEEIVDILDAIGKGVSHTEIIWDTSEGQWLPERLIWRDPRWFTFDRIDGQTPLLRDVVGNTPLMPFKFIQHRFSAKSGLPIRGGLARVAAWAWMFKAYTQRDWTIFTQTYGQPIRIGKYETGATEEEKETLFKAVANIASDCAAIIPRSMLIEFVESQSIGASTEHYERRSNWLDMQVSKGVLGQTTTTDAVSGGHAVAKEHRQVQEDIERADAKALSATLNRDLVRPWIDLEFGPQKLYPRLVIARAEARDVKALTESIRAGVAMGLKVPKSFMHDLLGIPDAAPGEDVLEAPKPRSVSIVRGGKDAAGDDDGGEDEERGTGLNMAGQAQTRDDVDRIADAADDMTTSTTTTMIETVRNLVDTSATLEDVRDRLLEIRPALPERALADAMRQALAFATLAGEDDVTTT